MKKFIIFLGLFMGLASAMNIKEFEEIYHEEFANPKDEAKAAEDISEKLRLANLAVTEHESAKNASEDAEKFANTAKQE